MEEDEMKRKQVPALWERVFRAIAYACVGLSGVAVIVFYNSMGWEVVVWACFLIAGLPAALMAGRGRYRGEYIALPVMVGGLLIYALYEWIETFFYLPSVASALLASGLAAKFFSRLVHLHLFIKLIKEAQ